jgi:hypothetical protein
LTGGPLGAVPLGEHAAPAVDAVGPDLPTARYASFLANPNVSTATVEVSNRMGLGPRHASLRAASVRCPATGTTADNSPKSSEPIPTIERHPSFVSIAAAKPTALRGDFDRPRRPEIAPKHRRVVSLADLPSGIDTSVPQRAVPDPHHHDREYRLPSSIAEPVHAQPPSIPPSAVFLDRSNCSRGHRRHVTFASNEVRHISLKEKTDGSRSSRGELAAHLGPSAAPTSVITEAGKQRPEDIYEVQTNLGGGHPLGPLAAAYERWEAMGMKLKHHDQVMDGLREWQAIDEDVRELRERTRRLAAALPVASLTSTAGRQGVKDDTEGTELEDQRESTGRRNYAMGVSGVPDTVAILCRKNSGQHQDISEVREGPPRRFGSPPVPSRPLPVGSQREHEYRKQTVIRKSTLAEDIEWIQAAVDAYEAVGYRCGDITSSEDEEVSDDDVFVDAKKAEHHGRQQRSDRGNIQVHRRSVRVGSDSPEMYSPPDEHPPCRHP